METKRPFSWRLTLFILIGLVLVLFMGMRIVSSITYPVVPAPALVPTEAQVVMSATLSSSDSGLVALIREIRALRTGGRAGAGRFLARLAGQVEVEEAFPMVVVFSAWPSDSHEKMHFYQAQSFSHFVTRRRMEMGCRPAPQDGKKIEYKGEKLFTIQQPDTSVSLAMAKNNMVVCSDEEVVKRTIDKVHAEQTALDLASELGILYHQFEQECPFVAAARNDGGQVRSFLRQVPGETAVDYFEQAEQYLGVSLDDIDVAAAGVRIVSSDKLEAAGVAVCTSEQAAAELAEAINARLQVPAEQGQWALSTKAWADGLRVNVSTELSGLKELILAFLKKAEEEAIATATAAAEATQAARSPDAAGGSAQEATTPIPPPPQEQTAH